MIESRFTVRVKMIPEKLGFFGKFKKNSYIVLKYQQANLIECVEFLEILGRQDFTLIEYLYDFITSYGDKKIDKKTFQKYYIHNLSKVLELLRNTRFRGLFDTEEEKEEKEENPLIDPRDFEAITEEFKDNLGKSIAFLSGKMGLDPKSIQKTYNFQEFKYWEEHYYYIERFKTEEGAKENQKLDQAKRVKREEHVYKAAFDHLEKYLSSKK